MKGEYNMKKMFGILLMGLVLSTAIVSARQWDYEHPCHDYNMHDVTGFLMAGSESPTFGGGTNYLDTYFWAEGTRTSVTWHGTYKNVLLISIEEGGTQIIRGKKTGSYEAAFGDIQTLWVCSR